LRESAPKLAQILCYVSARSRQEIAGGGFRSIVTLAWLAGEYFGIGPVRIKDFQWWIGVTAGRAKSAIAAQTVPSKTITCCLKGFEGF
jgi:hypothetical protein